MSSRRLFRFTFLVALTTAAFAASPVANVTSAGSFTLRGAAVSTDGVPSWPMLAGDEIRTSTAPAVIQFRDGSRVTLGSASAARVEQSAGGIGVRLSSGSMEVLARSSALQVYQNATAVPVTPGQVAKVSTAPKDLTERSATAAAASGRTRPAPVSSR